MGVCDFLHTTRDSRRGEMQPTSADKAGMRKRARPANRAGALAREQQNICELCIRISARYAARGRCGEGTCERRRILGEIPPDRCGSPRHSCAKSMAKREITSTACPCVTFVEPQTTKAKMLRATHYLSVTRAYHARDADKRRIHTV